MSHPDRKKRRELGLCFDCSQPAVSGYSRCEKHLEENRRDAFKYRNKNRKLLREKRRLEIKKRKKQGRCRTCGKKLHPEIDRKTECINCSCKLYFNRRRSYGTLNKKSTA
jgi:hypothetical protein